jgi:hypothetical protein
MTSTGSGPAICCRSEKRRSSRWWPAAGQRRGDPVASGLLQVRDEEIRSPVVAASWLGEGGDARVLRVGERQRGTVARVHDGQGACRTEVQPVQLGPVGSEAERATSMRSMHREDVGPCLLARRSLA